MRSCNRSALPKVADADCGCKQLYIMPSPLSLSPLRSKLRFGVRIDGVSVSDVVSSPGLQDQVRDALETHGLLLFPKQKLTPDIEAAFAKIFPWDDSVPLAECAGPFSTVQMTGVYGVGSGGSKVTVSSKTSPSYGQAGAASVDRWKLPAYPMVQIQGHGTVPDQHGVAGGTLTSAQNFAEWHTDGVHDVPKNTCPPAVTTMYCLDTPAFGGETLFASGRAGFQALPDRLKRKARRLSAEFDGRFRTCVAAGTRALASEVSATLKGECAVTNRWPLVITNASGEESLYALAPAFTRCLIEGGDDEVKGSPAYVLSAEESQAVLDEILSAALMLPASGWTPSSSCNEPIAETPNLLVHRWEVGDLIIWSNRSMLHSASPSPRYSETNGHRLFHRVRMSSKLPVMRAPSTPSPLLRTYCRLFAAQHFLMCGALGYLQALASASDKSTAPATSVLLAPLLALVAAAPSAWMLALSHVAVLCVNLSKLPMLWDFQVWDLQTDSAVVIALLITAAAYTQRSLSSRSADAIIHVAAPCIRLQYCILYALTAMWKLNHTFLDTRRSCAPIFFLQLLEAVVPAGLTPAWLPTLTAAIAPTATIAVEAAIPALLCFPGNSRRAGLALGLLLHLLIALTPPPNNAGAFSCCLLVRYFFFAPESIARAATDKRTLGISVLLAAVGFAQRPSDLAIGVYLGMSPIHVSALLSPVAETGRPPPVMRSAARKLRNFAAGAAVMYALGLPVLGLQDMMAPTMVRGDAGSKAMRGQMLCKPAAGALPAHAELAGRDCCPWSRLVPVLIPALLLLLLLFDPSSFTPPSHLSLPICMSSPDRIISSCQRGCSSAHPHSSPRSAAAPSGWRAPPHRGSTISTQPKSRHSSQRLFGASFSPTATRRGSLLPTSRGSSARLPSSHQQVWRPPGRVTRASWCQWSS